MEEVPVYLPDRIPTRRLPGTFALATTNLIAGFVAVNVQVFADETLVNRYLTKVLPMPVWGWLLWLSTFLLVVSMVGRRWYIFNVGASLSLFVWSAIAGAIFAVWLGDPTSLSALALALAWWAWVGQITMLVTPLVSQWRWPA